jgi:hypothetical protein
MYQVHSGGNHLAGEDEEETPYQMNLGGTGCAEQKPFFRK